MLTVIVLDAAYDLGGLEQPFECVISIGEMKHFVKVLPAYWDNERRIVAGEMIFADPLLEDLSKDYFSADLLGDVPRRPIGVVCCVAKP